MGEEDGVVGGETEMLRKVCVRVRSLAYLLRGEETMWHCVGVESAVRVKGLGNDL